jgi:hypothetical protein
MIGSAVEAGNPFAACLFSISEMDVAVVGSLGGSSFSPQKVLFFDFSNDFAFKFG